jgi:two-component system cell cycle sensor histidine kinase/response regulator CckA
VLGVKGPKYDYNVPFVTLRTLLVVEDERPVRDLLVTVLKRAGYDVRAAATAEEAVELEGERHVDLLLTDVMLPGMSGPELARLIRERSPETHVIFMSGYTGALLKDEDMAGADFLQKPFDAKTIVDKVRAILDPAAK